jgi:TRAP transporter TAXI family solute receptor
MRMFKATMLAGSLAMAMSGHALAQAQVAIAGAGPGSLAYNMAAGIAENTNTKTKAVRVTAESSSGFVENARLVGRGETELGITSGVQLYEALRAEGSYKGESPYKNLRGVAITHESGASIKAREGINTIADLEGKTISFGPPGSLLGYAGELILDAYGLNGKVKVLRMSVAETTRAFVEGTIDAFVAGPAPYPAVMEVAAQKKLNALPLDIEHIRKIQKSAPIIAGIMRAGAYDWLKKDTMIVGFLGYLVANKDTSPDAVYEILKANLSPKGVEYLKSNHKTWAIWNTPKYIKEDSAFALEGAKMHPGAVRYWKEQGVELPASIVE